MPAEYQASSNVVSMREYIEARIKAVHEAAVARADAQDKATANAMTAAQTAVNAAMQAAQAAVLKAEMATEKRFEGVNEFRAQLADQARTLMPRAEFEALHKAAMDRNELAHATMNERFQSLHSRMNAHDTMGAGKQIGWASVVSVIAVATSVSGLLLVLFKLQG